MADETRIITVKRGTTDEWGTEIQPLDKGELGYDMTANKYKGGTAQHLLPICRLLSLKRMLILKAVSYIRVPEEYPL